MNLFEIIIESTQSSIISLSAVHSGKAGLNLKRIAEFNKVQNTGEYCTFNKGYIESSDLAYLTAYSGDEFAWLIGKRNDILFHGSKSSCEFNDELSELLKKGVYRLEMHSHPGEDTPIPSTSDRNALLQIKQMDSKIISATTKRIVSYTNNACLDYLL